MLTDKMNENIYADIVIFKLFPGIPCMQHDPTIYLYQTMQALDIHSCVSTYR